MSNRFPALTSATLLALLLVLPAASLAIGAVAEIENVGEALVFRPTKEARGYTLTVSGPCGYRKEIASEKGELVFKLDEETFDGAYTYSLLATPFVDREVMAVQLKARETGDMRAVRRLCRDGRLLDAEQQTQTGGFVVSEGKVVFDPTPEIKRVSDRETGE